MSNEVYDNIKVNDRTYFTICSDECRIVFKDSEGITHVIVLPVKFYEKGYALMQSPSPKGTEEIADDAIKQIRSFNYPPKDFQLKAIILQALQSKQGWSEEDMIQAYIKGGLACIFNDGDMMQSPAYPEWLTQYKAEKGIV